EQNGAPNNKKKEGRQEKRPQNPTPQNEKTIPRPPAVIEKSAQPGVHRPRFAQNKEPANGVQNERCAEGGKSGEIPQTSQRRVGAGYDPSDQTSQERGEQRTSDGEIDGVQKRTKHLQLTKHVPVVAQGKFVQFSGELGGKETGLDN